MSDLGIWAQPFPTAENRLIALMPALRALVEADREVAQAAWLRKVEPKMRGGVEARRDLAALEVAAQLVASGWSPPLHP